MMMYLPNLHIRDGVMNLVYQTCQKSQLEVLLKLEKHLCMTVWMLMEDQS